MGRFSLRIIHEKFTVFLSLVSVGLGVISLLLVAYADEIASSELYIAAGVIGSFALASALIAAYIGIRWAYARRRRPWAWSAVRVLNAAAVQPGMTVKSRGISSRNGELAVSLPRQQSDFLVLGDLFLATNIHTRQKLGVVEVVVIEQDFCLCEVTDRMGSHGFWAGIENRMMHDFSPPSGVEFSLCINQDAIDFAKRLIRRWSG